MDFLWNKVTEWLKEMLIGSIMGNLTGLFDSVNEQVSEIATTVGTTPQGWKACQKPSLCPLRASF